MSASKRKGTSAESALVLYLKSMGYPYAERRALAGSRDRGDIAGIPGVVVEVKNCARTELAAWLDEAETERLNDGAHVGVVVHKRRGKSDVGKWFVSMDVRTFLRLLHEDSA